MNRRDFFSSLGKIGISSTIFPQIFVPSAPIGWKRNKIIIPQNSGESVNIITISVINENGNFYKIITSGPLVLRKEFITNRPVYFLPEQ